MSPRRSSRARTNQPPPQVPQHTHSSTSSSSSSRAERSTRSHYKVQSPNRAVLPRSESTEVNQDARRGDPPQTRQRKRGVDEDKDIVTKIYSGGNDEEPEEEEVTRCICGEQEYPGMPIIPADSWNRRNSKSSVKDTRDAHSSALIPELALEDAGGLFIQCDTCKVWQHGGCVGIMDEVMSPEEYFCEQCRPDLHIVAVGAKGYEDSLFRSQPPQACANFEVHISFTEADRIRSLDKNHPVTSLSTKKLHQKRHRPLQIQILIQEPAKIPNLPASVPCRSARSGAQR